MYSSPTLSHEMAMSASPLDMDSILYEVALARNSAAAAWASVTASSRRPRPSSTRITKPGSAGNSPQRPARRRTSASYRSTKYRSDLYSYLPTTAAATGSAAASASAADAFARPNQRRMPARPVSWHPSTFMSYMPPASNSQQDPSISPYHYNYQTVDFNGMPTPMAQPDLRANEPVEWNLHLDMPGCQPEAFPQPTSVPQNMFTTYASSSSGYGSTATMFPPLNNSSAVFSPSAGSMHGWMSTQPQTLAFTAPPTPDVLPIQYPADPLSEKPEPLPISAIDLGSYKSEDDEVEEPELVGMGLYDAPASSGFLFDAPNDLSSPNGSPTGKGLKLEETWEPPTDDDEDAMADGEDNDDEDEDSIAATHDDEDLHVAYASNISLPIQQSESRHPTPTNLNNAIISPATTIDMPIQHPPVSGKLEAVVGTDVMPFSIPIEHSEQSPIHPCQGYSGRTFYLDSEASRSMDEETSQMWLQAMLMQHVGSAMV